MTKTSSILPSFGVLIRLTQEYIDMAIDKADVVFSANEEWVEVHKKQKQDATIVVYIVVKKARKKQKNQN